MATISKSDLHEDRYSRLRLIPWWDQEKLAAARVLVIGAGALMILPMTVGICFVGWLIAGSTGAVVGLVLSGILGAIVLAKAGSSP